MNHILTKGPSLTEASAALILLHGRGGTAGDIVRVYDQMGCATIAALAPQAPGNTWYPYSFMAPLDQNQPFLDQSLARPTDRCWRNRFSLGPDACQGRTLPRE